jgi:predicted ATPase
VRKGLLYNAGNQEIQGLKVDSLEWSNWLEEQPSFRFETDLTAFTARRKARLSTWYWYAYRKRQGKLTETYIGKAEEVTLARLNAIAEILARQDVGIGMPRARAAGDNRLPGQPGIVHEAKSPYELTPPLPLPTPLTPLIDRVEEVAAVKALLCRSDVRFVNLIGPGGIGKTRIAIKVAGDLRQDFADGVYFLALDPVRDAQLVLSHVAQAIGLRVDGHRSVAELLKASLQQRELLLVLDNLEQVPAAATLLVDLLGSCPYLKILVTSREILHVSGEYPFPVSPLPFPDPADPPGLDAFRSYPAVELFLERARAIVPDLALDTGTIRAITEICARLEGLPLAIELAAARVRFLTPEALLQRLGQRLAVLTQGGPDKPARQQTLRATLDWSHELLSRDEQVAFRRLAVFAGGCDLEAAEAVCTAFSDIATPFLEVLSSLIDKSLLLPVRLGAQTPRFRLSETVHEYALEALALSGELDAVEEAHASYYLAFAIQAEPELDRGDQGWWLNRIDQDDPNLLAALNFLLSGHDRQRAVRLTGALGRYWYVRGRLSEGLNWIEQALGWRTSSVAAAEDRKTLYIAGLFAIHLDQSERARPWLEQSLELCRIAGDSWGYALAAHLLTLFFLLKDNLAAAQAQVERTASFVQKSRDAWALATAHSTSATLATYLGEFTRARTSFERSAGLFDEIQDIYLRDLMLLLAGDALIAEGDKARGQTLL